MQKLRAVLILALLFLGACSGYHNPLGKESVQGKTTSDSNISELPLSFAGVTQALFISKCLDCHGGVNKADGTKVIKADIDLTDYDALFSGPDPLLVKGDPEAGAIMLVIRTGEMPDDDRPRVTAEELEFLKAWVLLGAPKDEAQANTPPVATEPIILEPYFPPAYEPTPGGEPIIDPTNLTFERVYAEVFEPKCSRCHSGTMGEGFVDITSLEAIKNNFIFSDLLVKGSPAQSRIFREIDAGRMPYRGERLSNAELELVSLWILNGKDL